MIIPGADQQPYPSECSDRQAIFDLVRMERFWRDQAQWEKLAASYTEDSLVRVTWFEGTGREFVEASKVMYERGSRGKHLIFPTHVRIHGDRALIESPAQIHNRFNWDGVELDMMQYCRFFSRLRRTATGWLLASFEGIY